MKSAPRIGSVSEQEFVVDSSQVIDFTEGGMPAVLCTPALVGFLERTARLALAPHLEAGENSVGVELELKHSAPTPPGQTVVCQARVIHVDGRRITYQIEARDQQEPIAKGIHVRQVIRTERFAQFVKSKSAGSA